MRPRKKIYLRSGRLARPAPVCPSCGKLLDGYTTLSNPDAKPRPGVTTLCGYCLVWYEFYGEPLRLRAMSREEVAKIPPLWRKLQTQMVIDRALNPRRWEPGRA